MIKIPEHYYPHWEYIVQKAHEGRRTIPISELTYQFSLARFGRTRFETVWGSLTPFPGRLDAPRCAQVRRRQVVPRAVQEVTSQNGCAGCIFFAGNSEFPCQVGINPLQ